jgi:predicted P-loop ATPase
MPKKIEILKYYAEKGMPIFPCDGKTPLVAHGFKDASTDPKVIEEWNKQYPAANWAVRTGSKESGGAGLVVIDIDQKSHGLQTWEQLREIHSEPLETVSAKSGGGGLHLYFHNPDNGTKIKSGQNTLGDGIDVRADGGYIILPPSITTGRYTWELSPKDYPFAEIPEWILSTITAGRAAPKPKTTRAAAQELRDAMNALGALKKSRADNYQEWLDVGMSLSGLGDDGLIAWDNWSKQSDKYEPGACAQKWATFTPAMGDAHKISLGSLLHWADEDHQVPFIKRAPKGASPDDYTKALEAFGHQFSLNDMNDLVYRNGARMSDILMSVVEFGMRNWGYKSEKDLAVSINNEAYKNIFHPIKDYLNGLQWEGYKDTGGWHGIDQISNLCDYFKDRDGVFPQLIRKWLVGSVQRVMGPRPGQQHPMLVLDGPQGIGKSRFVWWLGSPLPAFFIQNTINCQDKDFLILLCSKFVWEVEELGATMRKSDIESLKAFLTKEIVNVRKPYGRDEITKPACASFIGTINNSGGFLADPTGSRRFRVCTLTSINWDYSKLIDVNQVWAQAVALFKAGETFELDQVNQEKMVEINNRYETDDPIQFDLFDTFEIDPARLDKSTATAQIIHRLRIDGKLVGGDDRQIAMRIANVLVRQGCEKALIRVNGQPTRVWRGVSEKHA